jgi:hypothetical protein
MLQKWYLKIYIGPIFSNMCYTFFFFLDGTTVQCGLLLLDGLLRISPVSWPLFSNILGLSGVNYWLLLDLRDALVCPTSEVRMVARREIIIMEGYSVTQNTARYTYEVCRSPWVASKFSATPTRVPTMTWELKTVVSTACLCVVCKHFGQAFCVVKFTHPDAGRLIPVEDPGLYTIRMCVYVCVRMYVYIHKHTCNISPG